jgi:hypothetical protein
LEQRVTDIITLLLLESLLRLGINVVQLPVSLLLDIGLVKIYGQEREVRLRVLRKIKKENINMGRLLVKIGLKIQKGWSDFKTWWNLQMCKLMFGEKSCPNKICICKKK